MLPSVGRWDGFEDDFTDGHSINWHSMMPADTRALLQGTVHSILVGWVMACFQSPESRFIMRSTRVDVPGSVGWMDEIRGCGRWHWLRSERNLREMTQLAEGYSEGLCGIREMD